MQLTSLTFFITFIISIGIYYVIPKNYQWYVLILYSGLFFIASTPFAIPCILINIVITWYCGRKISQGTDSKFWLAFGIIIDFVILAVFKYTGFAVDNINYVFGTSLAWKELIAPIGISFYTLQSVGYLLDVAWGVSKYEPSVLKVGLFVSYFPQLTSGPITRYREVSDKFFCGYSFDWKYVTYGLQRMLWGVFKKLVISARAGILVDTIYADTSTYNGFYITIAAVLFVVQLYTDFSGCMDIVIGASQCYGIVLPENFNEPFTAQTLQDYWNRWHLTLSHWLRDYILYPILKSNTWFKLNDSLKKVTNKKSAKKISTYLGMLIVWLLIGLWHGGKWNYILGMGLFCWLVIVIEDLIGFKTSSKFIGFLRCIKVFIYSCILNMFFRLSGLRFALSTMRAGLRWNPEIFTNGSLLELGLSLKNIIVLIVGVGIFVTVEILNHTKSVRDRISSTNIVIRWALYLLLIWVIVVFGMYGPEYNYSSFIYENF